MSTKLIFKKTYKNSRKKLEKKNSYNIWDHETGPALVITGKEYVQLRDAHFIDVDILRDGSLSCQFPAGVDGCLR